MLFYYSSHGPHGNTPLTLAVLLGHTEIAELLIEAGANCTAKNADGTLHQMTDWLPEMSRDSLPFCVAQVGLPSTNVRSLQ